MKEREFVMFLLRLGVAFAFIYPAVAAFFDPTSWIGFFPIFIRDMFPNEIMLLSVFGISKIAIAIWILSGKHIFFPSVLASIYLMLIIFFNIQIFDVLFRDVSILFMTLALATLHYREHNRA